MIDANETQAETNLSQPVNVASPIVAFGQATPMIYLTWPASLPCVIVLRDQWRRTAAGEVEAWYTRAQLAECVRMMRAALKETT